MPDKIVPACPECGRRVDELDPDAVRAAGCFPAAEARWKRVSRLR